jgi:hypothetical protein
MTRSYPTLKTWFITRRIVLLKKLFFSLTFMLGFLSANAQYVFKPGHLPEQISILEHACIADAGTQNLLLQQVEHNTAQLKFNALKGKLGNLGFTNHNYWINFELKNATEEAVFYYLQTAEPVTDNVNLFLLDSLGKTSTQRSGDNIDFAKRSIPFRKTIFKIELKPNEQKQAFIEVKNDGEKNSLPLELISQQKLLETVYHDQMMMGLFYGVLFVIAIT